MLISFCQEYLPRSLGKARLPQVFFFLVLQYEHDPSNQKATLAMNHLDVGRNFLSTQGHTVCRILPGSVARQYSMNHLGIWGMSGHILKRDINVTFFQEVFFSSPEKKNDISSPRVRGFHQLLLRREPKRHEARGSEWRSDWMGSAKGGEMVKLDRNI